MHIPGNAIILPFTAPATSCCNCGAPHVELVDMNFKHTRFMLLGGTETTLTMALPFCADCKASAKRYRQGYFSRALVAACVFWVLLGLIMIMGGDQMPKWLQENLLSVAAIGAVALTSAFYLSRRPKAPASSYYQPVYLRALKQSFRGEVLGITLGFTNEKYATQFSYENAAFCHAGALVIEKC